MKTLLIILFLTVAGFSQGKEEIKFSKAYTADVPRVQTVTKSPMEEAFVYSDTLNIREYRESIQKEYNRMDMCRTIHLIGGMATGILVAEQHYLESFVAFTITVVIWNFIKGN